MKILRLIFFILGFSAMAYMVFAADQVKTTETIIANSDVAVSTNQDYPFTLFIGDNLSGITNPLKSLNFTVSGVYTGGGSVALSINNSGTKTFTLPSVSVPTPFEIDYYDSTNQINPTSGGSYNYTLNYAPTSVTVYGLGIKMTETHKFVSPVCVDGTSEKVKTTETIIANSDVAVSTNQDYPFTLFIGDNLSGITNPLKSLNFTVSGVYTGGGSVALSINNSGTKTFTLPSVSVPTPFEIDYYDSTNQINPTSGGSYNYTLNYAPTSVTVYGLGIKMTETHKYKPPTCGGVPFGDLTSVVFDSTSSGSNAGYNSIMWKGTTGTGKVRFQFAAADCENGATNYPTCSTGSWNYIGGTLCQNGDWFEASPNSPVELKGFSCVSAWNNKRYFRYKVRICSATNCSDVGAASPVIDEIIVNWSP